MSSKKLKICWLTPDYFLNVDARIVPLLANNYSMDWILISTVDSQRTSEGLVSGPFTPKEYRLRYRQRDPRIISQYITLLSSVRKGGYDLVYTSFHGLPYFFPLLSIMTDLNKFVYGIHNVHTPRGASNEKAMRIYQRYALSVVKHFHVFSKYQLRTISSLVPNKHNYYAPLTPDTYGESTVTPPSDRLRFLFFGYIRPYKRLDLLLGAFGSLRARGIENIELVIAGRCDDWERYEPLIDKQIRIDARIGFVPNTDIPDLVSSCHYVVLPYQDSAQSGVLSMAYHYNKPVITSDIEGLADDVVQGHTGFMFKSLSQSSLVDVLEEAVKSHDTHYRTLTKNIKIYQQQEQSVEIIVAKYKKFIDHAAATATRVGDRLPGSSAL